MHDPSDAQLLRAYAEHGTEAAFAESELVIKSVPFAVPSESGADNIDRYGPSGYVPRVSHELIDEISLELGRRTATRLRAQPDLLQLAQDNLTRWSQQNANAPALLRRMAGTSGSAA